MFVYESPYYATLASQRHAADGLWCFVVDTGNIHQYELCSRGKAGVSVHTMVTSVLDVWMDGHVARGK